MNEARCRLDGGHAQEQKIELVARDHRACGCRGICEAEFFQLLIDLGEKRLIAGNRL